jgi:hypothetical protein
MEEINCELTQFDVPGGDTACTACSLFMARSFLAGGSAGTVDTIHRDMVAAIRQGAAVPQVGREYQMWTDVARSEPDAVGGLSLVYETNGYFDKAVAFPGYCAHFSDVFEKQFVAGTSGVLTTNGSSYMIGRDTQHYYLFDSHLGTLRRCRAAEPLFKRLQRLSGEYQIVLFRRCTSGTPVDV